MDSNSVWLGKLRQPIKFAMFGFVGAATLTGIWLIFGRIFLGTGIGMHQMLRPEGLVSVQIMLWLFLGALLFTSVFLSDTIGSIEPAPTGAMDWFSLVLSRLGMIAIMFVVIAMFYEVVSRYIFGSGTLWANELSLWIASFLFLLAGLYAMQQRSHIRIYIIYDLMPRWAQKMCDVISVVLICTFMFCLIWGAYGEAAAKFGRMETFGTAWDPPIPATLKPGVLIIMVLVAIQSISNLIADWNKAPEHHSPMDDIDETEIENIRATLGDLDDV